MAAFGNALHITSSDEAKLESEIAPLRAQPGYNWQRIEPGLEDVFIHLMRRRDEPAGEHKREAANAAS